MHEEDEGAITKAPREADGLRASAELALACRAPNRKLRMLVIDDDGFAPHHAALLWCSALSLLLSRTQEQCGYEYDY